MSGALYAELSRAAADLSERGLHASSKWAAEMLCGLPPGAAPAAAERLAADAAARAAAPDPPALLLARACFADREYSRAAHLLASLAPPPDALPHGAAAGGGDGGGVAAKALFLRAYSLYLAGEKRREEERVQKSGPLGSARPPNGELSSVEALLQPCDGGGGGGGGGGPAEEDAGREDEARALLAKSVTLYPCHWGAWQALQGLCSDLGAVSALPLPAHWVRDAFLAAACLELQHNAEALSRLQVINQLFPGSDWVTSSAAAAHYNMRNFDEAQRLYEDLLARDPHRVEDLLARDPHRVEGMDCYSNILYVKEQPAALSHLAHRSCCIIGNYYSLKGQHERAVEYFRRALRLSRGYQSAWTLMGHEFVEMKNAPAAIDAYRQAIEVSPRDYRAWYGLGQTYELLQMPYYALHYYRRVDCAFITELRAAMLRPGDPRMWCALGQCYESGDLNMPQVAVRCYRRAVANGDREGIALHKLAKLHEGMGDAATAAHYYRLNLERLDAEGAAAGSDTVDALLFLAEHCKDQGEFQEAEALCQRLMDVGGSANSRAKALMREMRSAAAGARLGGGGGGGGGSPAAAPPRPAPGGGGGGGTPGGSSIMEEDMSYGGSPGAAFFEALGAPGGGGGFGGFGGGGEGGDPGIGGGGGGGSSSSGEDMEEASPSPSPPSSAGGPGPGAGGDAPGGGGGGGGDDVMVSILVRETGTTRGAAAAALRRAGGDVVAAAVALREEAARW
ncbi:MAG: hypothetical protein J3K34DRAFT_518801 [Monoraphidium minutum]|nr:MAG: hypothetical protein J3K34DRAFT_518801 [Monoraphidium minutum]